MSKIRGRDTGIERRFQRDHPDAVAHPDWLPYSPDFLLGGVPVYLDSTFWHGYVSKAKYGRMNQFWKRKLFRNILRDHVADSFWEAVSVLKRIVFD